MKFPLWLLSVAAAPMGLTLSAIPADAFQVNTGVALGPFHLACPQGSGFSSVSGTIFDFQNYLNSSPDGSCYLGNVKFSQFGNLSLLQEMRASVVILNQVDAGSPGFSQVTLGAFSRFTSLLPETTLDYKVSGWNGGATPFHSFLQWTASASGAGNFDLITTASPSLEPACSPEVVTSALSPVGPPCTASPGSLIQEMAMTNRLTDWMGMDSMSGPAIINQFTVTNILPPEGTSPVNPFLPPPPQRQDEPWVFPPVVVTDPGQVWWYDPDVAIGYIYQVTDPAGPLFDQYTAPDLPFNDTYELLSSGGNACSGNPEDFTTSLATITQNVPYDFTTPLACFAIKGISEQNALDPLNTTAFVAGISFDRTGTVSVTQTPIPTPGPLPLTGAGVAYSWARGLRRRLNAASGG
jgi:hypothetical protein